MKQVKEINHDLGLLQPEKKEHIVEVLVQYNESGLPFVSAAVEGSGVIPYINPTAIQIECFTFKAIDPRIGRKS